MIVKEQNGPSLTLHHFQSSASRLCFALLALLCLPLFSHAQDTGYISGTVTDNSGAVVVGAEVVVSLVGGSLTRTTETNTEGAYVAAGLPAGTYNVYVTAKGFQKYQAKDVVLAVAQKARVDVQLIVGSVAEQVVVTGEKVAQVDTQTSELAGTVTGRQITQLMLNGRNFTQLATIVPGVSNQTGQDEAQVGVYGSTSFSFNGGRAEYNNWELDGGDIMDNGSNNTLNVYTSVDAIAEVKVLTSNYGAQFGRNGSGTVVVETKSGTNKFHGDAYYFGRNDAFNARKFFETERPAYKKHDFGYTIGGPVFIPGHYNANKDKTFFFWSEEWRREKVPGQTFNVAVPSLAERGEAPSSTPGFADFTDLCPGSDCPNVANPAAVPIDPNAQVLMDALIPKPNAPASVCGGIACFNASPVQPTHWREELVRVDHNINSKFRLMFRYIHDSWDTVTPTTLWAGGCPDGCSFPTIQTNFKGPGTSTVVRLTAEASPTLLNEFVFSYNDDHIFLTNTGPGAVARSSTDLNMAGLFGNNFGDKLPGIRIIGGAAYNGGFDEDPAYIPWNNSNPTYTFKDNVTKLTGKHNLQFGAYVVVAQKNEQSSLGNLGGNLVFNSSNSVVGTGNAFADLLLGNIDTFQQANLAPKYYFRYQIVEPYFQDDWRITSRLTLNLGLRWSFFGTYREKFNNTFNFERGAFNEANAPGIGAIGELIDPVTGADLSAADPRAFNGLVQCGGKGVPSGCISRKWMNPGPRVGFAWDPWGTGKTALRGGYGIFFEHGNGNEANVEALEATPPFVLVPSQPNITGYGNIGGGLAFPLGFNAIGTKGLWPYVQQWNLNLQHEFPQHFVGSVAYVGSKGTHLGRNRQDLNQVLPVPLSQNPYKPGEAIGPNDCTADSSGNFFTPSGVQITGQALVNLGIACGNDPNPSRPFVGFGDIAGTAFGANSIYHALQLSARRSIAPLTLSVAYTYSHTIDNSSEGSIFSSGDLVDATDLRRARANSNFDQRHLLSISYVYDLPFFRASTGLTNHLLGGWQFAGITSIQTGVPFSVVFSGFSDNAGVANGVGPGTYADLVGDPQAVPPDPAHGPGPLLFNPGAFAAPRGLTFGNAGRNLLHMPRTTNFDMSLLKHFKIKESTGFEFRAEAFNIFNHTQWTGSSSGGVNIDNDLASSTFVRPTDSRRARTLQLGLKFLF
jgi:hypothetical protein